ncbi:hypothetical protein BdWA1_000867 [Babesia duncani]|uniref:Uncharacterized protein n=1 Tax=Babesia duncani TaxID=323732 RepID=A0AAD9PMZ4_9APIC|nr:hypothetical protein BdWA1_000867 [Babesia duncani]
MPETDRAVCVEQNINKHDQTSQGNEENLLAQMSLNKEISDLLFTSAMMIYHDLLLQKEKLDEKRGAIGKRQFVKLSQVKEHKFSEAKFVRIVDELKEERMMNKYQLIGNVHNIKSDNIAKEIVALRAKIEKATAERDALYGNILNKYKELFEPHKVPFYLSFNAQLFEEARLIYQQEKLKKKYEALRTLVSEMGDFYTQLTQGYHRK